MLNTSDAVSTKGTYKTNWGHWVKFCGWQRIPVTAVNEPNLIRYAAHRFRDTDNFGVSIDKQISAIISVFNTYYNKGLPIDRNYYFNLRRIIKSIKKKPGRVDHNRSVPIDYKLLEKMVDACDDSFNGRVLATMFVFAKSFALRSGDYTPNSKNPEFLKWKDIKLGVYGQVKYVTLSMTTGKHNQFGKPEILTQACACKIFTQKICVACQFFKYKQLYSSKYNINPQAPLFKWAEGDIVQYTHFNQYFKKVLISIGETPSKYLKPHGFRFGGITDMRRHKVSDWLITKNTRHSIKSDLTWHYTVMTSEEEGFRIREAMLKNKKNAQAIFNLSNTN